MTTLARAGRSDQAPAGGQGEIRSPQEEVRELARIRGAVILAHNYQVPDVQDVADFVGDSEKARGALERMVATS